LCYPDLTLKELDQIIADTFEKTLSKFPLGAKNGRGPLRRIMTKDLYAIALMENFLANNRLPELEAMTPEQRLQLRKTAGRRRTKRRLHKRKPKK
jgi:hypothetical protein